jgi:hypothetical protein
MVVDVEDEENLKGGNTMQGDHENSCEHQIKVDPRS